MSKLKSRLEKDIETAKKLLTEAQKQLSIISDNKNKRDIITDEILEYEKLSEKIVNNARLMVTANGNCFKKDILIDNIVEENNVQISLKDNHAKIVMPLLLPRKEKGNPSFARTTLDASFRKYIREKGSIDRIIDDVVLIFGHTYDKDRPERSYRDHDNIELNAVIDILALYLLTDDSALKCRHYYYSEQGNCDSTEIYIIPCDEFGKFIQNKNYFKFS